MSALAKLAIAGTSAVLVLLLLATVGVNLYTEYLWFDSFGALQAFLPQYRWWWTLWLVGTVFASGWLIFFGLRPLRVLGFTTAYKLAAAGAALLSMVSFGPLLASKWSTYLLYHNQTPYGMKDPIFGREISYYLFSLPWLNQLSVMAYILILATAIALAISWGVTQDWWQTHEQKEKLNTMHLAGITLQAIMALIIFAYRTIYISIPSLVYTDHGRFYGAGVLEANLYYWLYTILAGLTIAVAALVVYLMFRWREPDFGNRLTGILLIVGVWAFIWLVPIEFVIPKLVHKFKVGPNEITVQEPYIKNNIAMTKEGFGLSTIEAREFKPVKDMGRAKEIIERNPLITKNVRIWDLEALHESIQQLHGLRRYYHFGDIDVDRYMLGGEYRQVMISARELNTDAIPSKNWINLQLQYTHGYGAVVVPVNTVEANGMPHLFVKDFPPKSDYPELAIKQPQIYFGEETKHWVLINTTIDEIDYPSGDDNVLTRYKGKGGVKLSSLIRRLVYSYKKGSWDLLISGFITRETRILYDRTITEIVKKIAPFLTYDSDPYLVIAEGKLYWIIDALTTSRYFPHSHPVNGVNYVRNSVKVVVDAYDGTTTFYVFDERDPLIRAYTKIYGVVFRPQSEMPSSLRAHVRFSEDLLQMMAEAYKIYHMENPHTFYNKEDEWVTAREIRWTAEKTYPRRTGKTRNNNQRAGEGELVKPYYIVEKFPGTEKEELVLMLPFTPAQKQNLIGWLAARIEGSAYGKLLAYQFPKDEIVFGTMQIEARINQDTEISKDISLWSQRGSRVLQGNLLVIPVENVLLYVEPLFLVSETSAIPELKRVTASVLDRVVMAPTLQGALQAVFADGAPVVSSAPQSTVVTPRVPSDAKEILKRIQRDLEALEKLFK